MKSPTIVLLAVSLLASCLYAAVPAPRNVLFIVVDDLRAELGCYGETQVHSPNIDRLAGRGTVFTRAYCQQALCSPSRTSVMTGLRPDSTGVYDLKTHFRKKVPRVVTLPQHFKAHGYYTQPLGKIYHGSFEKVETGRALDDLPSWSAMPWLGRPRYYFTDRGVQVAREVYAQKSGKRGPELDGWTEAFVQALPNEAPDVPDCVLYDGEMTDQAIRALHALKERRSVDRPAEPAPFFLAVGYQKPHLPFVAPRKYWDLYDPATFDRTGTASLPKDAPSVALPPSSELRGYHGVPKQGPLAPSEARHLRHGYYACVSFVDAQIGRLLDELDRLGLTKNTIIVLWGDHGFHLGDHGHWGKHTNFEVATRAPLIVSAPGAMEAGGKVNALVEFVDIYPTLCELAGLPLPEHLEGTSLVPLLKDPRRAWKTAAFSQYPRPGLMGYTMRTDRHRLTLWQAANDPAQVKAVELYDYLTDPAESVNLAGRPEHATLVRELTSKLRAGWRGARPGR